MVEKGEELDRVRGQEVTLGRKTGLLQVRSCLVQVRQAGSVGDIGWRRRGP
jgi:hypothetical protein